MWLLESGHLRMEDEERDHDPEPDMEPPDEDEEPEMCECGYDTSMEWELDHPGKRYVGRHR